MTPLPKACGHPDCGVSTAIDDETLTHGRGDLDKYGFWEIPCPPCARAAEKRSPEYGKRWPYEPLTSKDVDALAVGPNPERRVIPPLAGLRCAKCHWVAPNPVGCGLCNPTGPSRMKAIAEGRIPP